MLLPNFPLNRAFIVMPFFYLKPHRGHRHKNIGKIILKYHTGPNRSTAYSQQLSQMSDLPTPQLRKWQNREALNKDQTTTPNEDRPERVSEEVAKARKSYQEAPKAYRKESSYVQAGQVCSFTHLLPFTFSQSIVAHFKRQKWPQTKMYATFDTIFLHGFSCPFTWRNM